MEFIFVFILVLVTGLAAKALFYDNYKDSIIRKKCDCGEYDGDCPSYIVSKGGYGGWESKDYWKCKKFQDKLDELKELEEIIKK